VEKKRTLKKARRGDQGGRGRTRKSTKRDRGTIFRPKTLDIRLRRGLEEGRCVEASKSELDPLEANPTF